MAYNFPIHPGLTFAEQELESNPEFSPEMIDIADIEQSAELPDGSAVYTIGKKNAVNSEKDNKRDFFGNLAEDMDDGVLRGLSARLLEEIQDDRESRREWENTVNLAFKYLGLKIEEFRPEPFAWACGAYDTTLSTTLMNFFAMARASLFPPGGPAKVAIEGVPTDEIYDRAERVKLFINYFLTAVDRPYYADSDKLILFIGLYGCAFRKIIMDPVLEHPTARLVMPQDLIVNNNCTSLLDSTRITQEIMLTRREVLIRQRNKIYLEDTLPSVADDMDEQGSNITKTIKNIEGVKTNSQENKTTFKFYECHVELVADEVKDRIVKKDRNIPRPYIVEINQTTKKICSIRRNWKESDLNYKRRECFVHYCYLPGFGLYGIGLAQLLGSNAIVLSTITRQQLDAGTLKNFPGGLRQRGMRLENNDKAIGPAEFWEIETGGSPIQDAVMLMPYGEPSSVLAQLRTELKQETAQLGGASQQGIQDVGGNTPVGTILAQLEVQNRVPSTILKSMYVSLGEELCILKDLFAEYFGDNPYPFNVPGNQSYVMKADFSDNVSIVPVADPNVLTTTQRIIVSEMLLKFAQSAPDIHNVREAFHRMYSAMNIQDIDKILPPPPQPEQVQPLNPITENMNAMSGKPLEVGIDQNHQAHLIVHGDLLQKIAEQNPKAAEILQAHMTDHTKMQYFVQMQAEMGMQMPDAAQLQDPQVQNAIAVHAAQVIQQKAQEAAAANPPPLDPVRAELELGQMEIEQKREASKIKYEESQLRAETEAFKAQSKFESEKDKLEAQERMASEKNELTLAIEQMKNKAPLESL